MSDAFQSLDGDIDQNILVDFDPPKLVKHIDVNSDG
jgi:hypothetical protein